jgi:hypothetical protein
MLKNVVFDFFEDFALDVFGYLLLLVASLFESLVKCFVLAAHQYDHIEVVFRKDIRTVEIKE